LKIGPQVTTSIPNKKRKKDSDRQKQTENGDQAMKDNTECRTQIRTAALPVIT